MADYKWLNHEKTVVSKTFNGTVITKNGTGWLEYQQWVIDGGITEPYMDRDELEADALSRLWAYHDQLITSHSENSLAKQIKKTTKLSRVLRKENKGEASVADIKLLDDNDILDTWYDEIERAAEDDGESWIENPATTNQELIDFDPATRVSWPVYPF